MEADSGLAQQIVVTLRRITRAIDRHSRELGESFGLTAPQIHVLQVLSSGGPLPTGELARRVHLAQATVSEILDRLQRLGFVERTRSPSDKRKVECAVTRRGLDLLARKPPLLHETFVAELQKLSEWERSFLLAALQRMAAMMSAETIEVAPVLATGPPTVSAETMVAFLSEQDPREDAGERD